MKKNEESKKNIEEIQKIDLNSNLLYSKNKD